MSAEDAKVPVEAAPVEAESGPNKRKADTFDDETEEEPAFAPSKDAAEANDGTTEETAAKRLKVDDEKKDGDGEAKPEADAAEAPADAAPAEAAPATEGEPVKEGAAEAAPAGGAAASAEDGAKPQAEFRDGDWICPECSNHNFASRVICRRCPQVRPGVDPDIAKMQMMQQTGYGGFGGGGGGYGGGPRQFNSRMRPGDWICPDPSCANLNFASRTVCRMCPMPRPAGVGPPGGGGGGGGGMGGGGGGMPRNMRPGDWICPKQECSNHNFASRMVCRMCNTPKPEGAGFQPGQGQGGPPGGAPPAHGGQHSYGRPGHQLPPPQAHAPPGQMGGYGAPAPAGGGGYGGYDPHAAGYGAPAGGQGYGQGYGAPAGQGYGQGYGGYNAYSGGYGGGPGY